MGMIFKRNLVILFLKYPYNIFISCLFCFVFNLSLFKYINQKCIRPLSKGVS